MNQTSNTPLEQPIAQPQNELLTTDTAEQDVAVEIPQTEILNTPSDEELDDSLAQLLRDAEYRGYLRARNEIARAAMKKPRLWENSRRSEAESRKPAVKSPTDTQGDVASTLSSDFLTHIRPCVWD